jgi:hypothetical protein
MVQTSGLFKESERRGQDDWNVLRKLIGFKLYSLVHGTFHSSFPNFVPTVFLFFISFVS